MDEQTIMALMTQMAQTGMHELDYRVGDAHLRLKKAPQEASAAAATPQPVTTATAIPAPLVGIVYLAPKPDAEPFVTVGAHVDAGQVVCVIESMKMMNEVKSPASGTLIEVAVVDSALVEFDQPLFLVEEDANA